MFTKFIYRGIVVVNICSFMILLMASFKPMTAEQKAKKKSLAKQEVSTNLSRNYPCISFDPSVPNLSKDKAEIYGKYEKLFRFGYPTDVPLSQAVKEFNECHIQKGDEPLTEEEVLMAVMYGREVPDVVDPSPELIADTKKIVFKKLMPKGARFEVDRTTERSLFSDDEEEERKIREAFGASKIILKQWRITLYRGLDTNPITPEALNPDQKLLIRQRFYGFEKFAK